MNKREWKDIKGGKVSTLYSNKMMTWVDCDKLWIYNILEQPLRKLYKAIHLKTQ